MIFWFQMGWTRGMQGEKDTKRELNSYDRDGAALFWTQNGRQRLPKHLPKWLQIKENGSKKLHQTSMTIFIALRYDFNPFLKPN